MKLSMNQRACSNATSWVLVLGLALLWLFLKVYGSPHISGFYCFDKDISLPYKGSTVNSGLNGAISYLTPIILSIFAHHSNLRRVDKKLVINNTVIILFFGLLSQDVTDLLKLAAGRLRPHFLDVCNVEYGADNTCDKSIVSQSIYIQNYSCKGNSILFTDKSEMEDMIPEARLSFPSGHSSMAFYGMVTSIFILNKTQGNQFILSVEQALCLLYCCFVGVTRVNDHKHHTDDVVAGALLGTLFAVSSALNLTLVNLGNFENKPTEEFKRLMSSSGDFYSNDDAERGKVTY